MNCLKFFRQHQNDVDNEKVEAYSSLPRLSFESPASKICYLSDIDADLNMPFESDFAYYTPHDLHSNYDINQCFLQNQNFSIIDCNIRRLSANFDNMTDWLSSIFFPFSLIGITEMKIRSDHSPIMNIDLPGYQFVSQPTLSDWDLSSKTEDYESLWIEVNNDSHSNLICGIVYRHPNGNLDNFIEYLNFVTDKVNKETKYCTMKGDFNLDLLKIDSHTMTDNFLNIMGSIFFQPHILQPTR